AGGPPCQGFSTAGKRRFRDPRNRLFEHYLELVELVQPRMVLLENVPGIIIRGGGYNKRRKKQAKAYSEIIVERLSTHYHIFTRAHPLTSYGVPQRRQRFILIGFRKWKFKRKKLVDPFDLMDNRTPSFLKKRGISKGVTVQQAISDLRIARNGVKKS